MEYIENFKCKICGEEKQTKIAFGMHLSRKHAGLSLQDYTVQYILDGQPPQCACGCGESVLWHKSNCRFNEYINGHNSSGFGDFVKTTESEQRRKQAICQAYKERGDIIKQKIADGVSKSAALSKRDFSKYFLDKWQDPDFVQAQSDARIKAWAGDVGEFRKQKVFTKEFGKKISIANAKRDAVRKSKAEKLAIETLQHQLKHEKIVVDYWMKLADRNLCVDAFIPSCNVAIEFDGTYWHALDRDEDLTYDQIVSAANDMQKNRLFADAGLELIRLKEGTDIHHVSTLDDLRNVAYHRQVGHVTVKDGSFRLKNDNQKLIKKERLLRSADAAFTKKKLLPAVDKFFVEHVKAHGWMFPRCDDDVQVVITKIQKHRVDETVKRISSFGEAGNDFLKSSFKSFWCVDGGPVAAFNDEKIRQEVVKYRLGINNSKLYEYQLDGVTVNKHETFDITLANIRRGFVVRRNAVSWFKPTVAYEIYKRVIGNSTSPIVWDPSAGFGARLLGFVAAYPQGKYVGCEPANQTFSDLVSLKDSMVRSRVACSIELHQCPSETFIPTDNFDVVFTSPPYFDKEKYFNEPTQCFVAFPSYEQWLEFYMLPTLRTAAAHLRRGGKVVINIDKKNAQSIISIANTCGLSLVDSFFISLRRDHFSRKKGVIAEKTEPVLIFCKQE